MEAIYLKDSYLQSFEAAVVESEGESILLDRTAFYPASGGQPSDQGRLTRGDEEFMVLEAEISGEGVIHRLDRPGLDPGNGVTGVIDWDRRYRLMQSHTACHVLSAVIFRETGAKITGNQVDVSRSRVDFSLEQFDRSKMVEYVEMSNEIVQEDRPVKIKVVSKKELEANPELIRLAMAVPDRDWVRVVEIEEIDAQACGGTHVKSTGEISGIKMVKAQNKGRANRRVYFELQE